MIVAPISVAVVAALVVVAVVVMVAAAAVVAVVVMVTALPRGAVRRAARAVGVQKA